MAIPLLAAAAAVVLVLAGWFEVRDWRKPRSLGRKPDGPDEFRQHVETTSHMSHSFRQHGDYRRGH